MRINLKPKLLFDSPFCGEEKEEAYYIFERSKLEELKYEILNGNPSCFLVSGYRGVGKTSFLRKVEKEITDDKSNGKVVFVHTSFARYNDQTHLLRKLIRELYLSLDDNEYYKRLDSNLKTEIETLYRRTFHDISNTEISKSAVEKKKESKRTWDWKALMEGLKKHISIVVAGLFATGWLAGWFENHADIVAYVTIIGSLLWSVLGSFKTERTKTTTITEQEEVQSKTLYDDEIAEYYLHKVLRGLKELKLNLVFVLDELDKIEESDIDKLLNEMKPFLVSGNANFIVVAGQSLYYRYHSEQFKDDSVLSSLFSKTFHVSLHSPDKLRRFFDTMTEGSIEDEKIDAMLAYYIFRSHLIPRRFVNLIRQDAEFDETGSCFIGVKENLKTNYGLYVDGIQRAFQVIINDHADDAVCDFYLQNLYMTQEQIINNPEGKKGYDDDAVTEVLNDGG